VPFVDELAHFAMVGSREPVGRQTTDHADNSRSMTVELPLRPTLSNPTAP
jgi:hypothetical protein